MHLALKCKIVLPNTDTHIHTHTHMYILNILEKKYSIFQKNNVVLGLAPINGHRRFTTICR